jgi:hypothetical protein
MSRDVTPAFAAALAAQNLRPAIFFEGEFASGFLRLWSGLGDIQWNGETWTGAGTLLGIGAIEETGDVVANGCSVALSGVPADLVSAAILEARQGRAGRIWLALLSETFDIIDSPSLAFSGRLDVPEISDTGDTCVITISYESRLIDLNVAREWRYTHEAQQVLSPGDLGFQYVTAIQELEIKWGRS